MKNISRIVACGAAAMLAGAAADPAHAASWSFRLLYSFCTVGGCVDGAAPHGGIVFDASGNAYGTTYSGGTTGEGTVFELTRGGKEIVLHDFSPSVTDGGGPMAGLLIDSSENLYGTTRYGGAHGAGTVFEKPHKGAFRIVDSLQFGQYPEAGVIIDKAGNLYGTTTEGGAHGGGTVFEVTRKGQEQTLYSFCAAVGCSDGKTPQAGLIMDAAGNLYGTTAAGGAAGQGLVFRITPQGNEKILCNFLGAANCTSGAEPLAGLISDKSGNLYGTTFQGGAQNRGTVFEIASKGRERLIYSFCPLSGCSDGYGPAADLVMDRLGNLYGTTSAGGAMGAGTVFEVTAAGKQSVIYNFCEAAQCTDGELPLAGLTMDKSGNLYGTTSEGGAGGGGTVFELVRQR
jgi:uncharacterized repeat protein (TIGR03803 family)